MSATDAGPPSERRVVAVLFADIAGFTAMTERLDPETVTDVMNEIFAALGAEVEAVGGHVDKVIGDSLMALFGAPVAHEDDAVRAVRAALAMQRAIEARRETLQRALGQAVRLRIGIHSGQVVWGVVGPPGQALPTVMGDVVNLASRLQRAAPEGGVLVSDAVYRQVRGVYLCKAWEPLVVRGKAEPVAVYEILGERERAEAMYRPPFVDRRGDLEQLEDLFARVRRGRAQVVVIIGDPGVGKTRLVEEFTGRLSGDVALLQTACPPYGGQSLGPLADLFRRQFAGLAGAVTLQDVEARIPLGDRAPQAAVILSRLFGLAEVPPGDEVSHETALLVAAEAIRRMLTRPTVVWIEDLQWADPGTRELLPFIVERLNETPLLLIGNLRAAEEPLTWGRRTAVDTVQLDPLPDEDARALLAGIVGESLPDEVERALIAKAGGNPFYLTEIVGTLRSMGTLVKDDRGRWRVTGSVEKVLPDTIQGALLARLDRLAPDLRVLVQRAAVVGTSFSQSLLAALSPGVDVAEALPKLEDAYLIRRNDPLASDPEFTFVHPLLREVAYNSLLTKQQVALHRQIADAMERLYPDRVEEMAKTIGTHYDLGGRPEKALPHLLQAGKQAFRRYAIREAIELLERARVLAEGTGQEALCVEVCEALGELYTLTLSRGPKERFAVWQYVFTHVDSGKEPARVARAMLAAALARATDNLPGEALELLRQAEGLIPINDPLWSGFHVVRSRALLLRPESKYAEALEAAKEAVEIANRVGTLTYRAEAYYALSHPALLPLLGDEGPRIMREWAKEVEQSGNEWLLTPATLALLSDAWTRGLVDEDMLRMSQEALRRAEKYDLTSDEARLRVLLGRAQFLLGRWPEADAHLSRAHELIEAHGGRIPDLGYLITLPYSRGNLAIGYCRLEEARQIFEHALSRAAFHAPIWLNHDLARTHLMLGNIAEALVVMKQSLAARDKFRCIICGCQASGVAAEFYATLGEAEQARTLIHDAEETAGRIGHIATAIRVRRAQAQLALREGSPREAVKAVRDALALGEQMPLPQPCEHGQTLLLLGDAYQAAGEHDRPIAFWQEARCLFSRLGALWHLKQAEEALSRAG